MKSFSILLVISSLVVLSQGQSFIKSIGIAVIRAYCDATTFANPMLILKVRGGDFTVDDERVKKYAFCVYKTVGMATPEGNGDKEAGLKLIYPPTDPAIFAESFDACNNQEGPTPQDKLWNLLVCYNTKYPGDISAL